MFTSVLKREAAIADQAAIETGNSEQRKGGSALVGAGPGAKDLITLSGVQRLPRSGCDLIMTGLT